MAATERAREWDVIVVGAGVAGAMSAIHLVRSGLRVLLVEKSSWPRDKACGGCLSGVALRMLARTGIALHEGSVFARMQLACRGRTASLPLPCGIAVSRRWLDATLVKCAVSEGAFFLPATRATLEEASRHERRVTLRQNTNSSTAVARVVLDCGGLASRLMPEVGWRVLPRSRIGVGASWGNAPPWPSSGVIYMACSKHGYVGFVRAESGITNIAAALDPAHCRKSGGPARAVEEILKAAGLSVPEQLDSVAWRGTPHLSRTRCRLAAERVLILGDAAGYVEPLTGEGMAWALADAAAVFPFVREAVACWSSGLGERWSRRHANMVRARHGVCLKVSKWLRHPNLLAAALPLLDFAPATVAPLMARLNRELNAGDVVAG